ncbi:MAG TPA: 4-amino-4-deoxychorismate lyase [Crocinitomicaceae bacterium]|nr:4-amino-4-deoxychorismate lyase [Flavobacteriales bacterium]HBW86242.1 4-amino-4-deoxychorismate lyase [Crocinitomicaceae bacterium]
MAISFVNNNGTILPADAPTIHPGNRGHLYGDGVFESIRVIAGKPLNMENHIKRLLEGAKAIKMRTPSFFNTNFFEEKIKELLYRSAIKEGGRCRLSLDRVTGGAYLPDSNECTYYIEVYPYDVNHFELNAKGLEIDIYQDIKLQKNFLSNYKTKAGLTYVMAALSAQEKGLDDLFLSNDRGNILETSSCNVFVVSNGVLYTPGLDEGCLAGTMRMQIINLALANGIKVYECAILPQNLLAADEIFVTNAIRGVNWIGGYRTKRFYNNMSRKLVVLLNEFWEKQLEL